MADRYAIKVTIDQSTLDASTRKSMALLDRQEAAAKRVADAVQRATDKAAREAERAAAREAAARQRGLDQAERAAAQFLVKDERRRQQHADRVGRQEVESARRAAERAAAERERVEVRSASRSLERVRRVMTEEEVMRTARNRVVGAANAQRVAGVAGTLGGRFGFNIPGAGGVGMGAGAMAFGGGALGIGGMGALTPLAVGAAAHQATSALLESIVETKRNAAEFGREALDYMVSLRPLASVVGRQPTAEFAKEMAGFGVKAGMSKEQAATFMETFAGRANIVKGKTISEPEYEKYSLSAAQMATARGISPEAAGDIFAAVLKIENFKGKANESAEALARASVLFDVLDAGTGKIEQLLPQAIELISALASENALEGMFRSAGEIGVLTSLMAERGPQEAAVFGRNLMKASYRTDKKIQPFLKETGITPGMAGMEILERGLSGIGAHVAKGENLQQVLMDFGLATNVREMQAWQTAFAGRERVLKPQMERLRGGEGPGGVARAQQAIAAAMQRPDVRYTQAQAAVEAAKIERGIESAPMNIARLQAEAALVSERMDESLAGAFQKRAIKYLSLWQVEGREAIVERRAVEDMLKGAGIEEKSTSGAVAEALGVTPESLPGAALKGKAGGLLDWVMSNPLAEAQKSLFGYLGVPQMLGAPGNEELAKMLGKIEENTRPIKEGTGPQKAAPGPVANTNPIPLPARAAPGGQAVRQGQATP